MRAKRLFERTGLTFLLMLLAWTFAFGQAAKATVDKIAENPLAVKVLVYESNVDDYYTLVVVNPHEAEIGYFAKKRYKVEWLNYKGRLISNKIFIRAKCNERFMVIVTDRITKEVEGTMVATPYCIKIMELPPYHAEMPKY